MEGVKTGDQIYPRCEPDVPRERAGACAGPSCSLRATAESILCGLSAVGAAHVAGTAALFRSGAAFLRIAATPCRGTHGAAPRGVSGALLNGGDLFLGLSG